MKNNVNFCWSEKKKEKVGVIEKFEMMSFNCNSNSTGTKI
jgi:hypothetical protein